MLSSPLYRAGTGEYQFRRDAVVTGASGMSRQPRFDRLCHTERLGDITLAGARARRGAEQLEDPGSAVGFLHVGATGYEVDV